MEEDSDYTEASDQRVLVEHTSDVLTYQGARVGVLGGGVKLGMSALSVGPRSTLQIVTKEGTVLDSDAEMLRKGELTVSHDKTPADASVL